MSSNSVKVDLRARLLAGRAAMAADRLSAAAEAVTRHVLDRLAGTARVAAYVPVGREPGSVVLLDALRGGGTEVLLPVVLPTGLGWARYDGEPGLVAGPFGTRQPDGPALGPDALGTVGAVLVPALAVDHHGVRLGRGGGYYDRALARATADTALVALLHDGELLPRLPADAWDRNVTAVVRPGTGWTELPVVEHDGR